MARQALRLRHRVGRGPLQQARRRRGDARRPFPVTPGPLQARQDGAAPHRAPHRAAEPAGRLVRRSRPPPLQRAAAPASPRPPRRAVARGSRLRSDRHTRPQRCARGAGLGQRGVPSRGATGLCADRRVRRGGGGRSVDDPGRRGLVGPGSAFRPLECRPAGISAWDGPQISRCRSGRGWRRARSQSGNRPTCPC